VRITGWMALELAVAVFANGISLCAQGVISAQSGLVYRVEGEVYLDGKRLDRRIVAFLLVKTGSEFRTGRGRAEIVLNPGESPVLDRAFIPDMPNGDSPVLKPGAMLRLGEDAAFRMLDNRLESARFEMLAGSALLDVGNLPKGTSVTGSFWGATIRVPKPGLCRLDVSPARVSVYRGSAVVVLGGHRFRLKTGTRLPLDTAKVEKFDPKSMDSLDRWNQWRAQRLSQANMVALKRAAAPPPRVRARARMPR
jgi:hypothetical protein